MFKVLAGCSLIVATALAAPKPKKGEPERIIFAVVPQYPSKVIHKNWKPLTTYLENTLNIEVEFKLFDDIQSFEKRLTEGSMHLVYMNPYHLEVVKENPGYTPLLVSSKVLLSGVLVAKKDSANQNLEDLQGKTLSFPAPNAFAASVLIRAFLQNDKKIKFTATYSGSHDNSYRAVLYGKADAAGGIMATYNKQPAEVKEALRIIYQTEPVYGHPIAAANSLSLEMRKKIADALMSYAQTEEGQLLYDKIDFSEPVRVDFKIHYQYLKNLKLGEVSDGKMRDPK